MNLSKSRYTQGVQCPKMLWMRAHMPEAFDETVMNQAVLATGNMVGDLAMGYYGDFTEVPFDASDFPGMARMTRQLIDSGERVICEATFMHDGNVCMVDILINEADGVRLVEVKSATSVHDIYLHDMAYQCWLLEQCGYVVKSAALMHVDNTYVRCGALDLHGLFKVEDRTEAVRALMVDVGKRVAYLKAVAEEEFEPGTEQGARSAADVARAAGIVPLSGENACGRALECDARRDRFAIGPHCASPYPCGFRAWCWKDVPHPSVFDLGGYGLQKAFSLADKGIVTLDDMVRAGVSPRRGIPARQVELAQTGAAEAVCASSVKQVVSKLSLPLYFLDFETFQPAVPPFDGVHPYQQIPTQYSLHIVRDDAADLAHAVQVDASYAGEPAAFEHHEFLAQAGTDPRRALAEALVGDIAPGGCVVAYNMSFERMVIRDLAARFPDLRERLYAIHDNMVDLIVPFRSGSYYAAAQQGSFSIKAVLPALFPDDPELDYHALDGVHNGAEASATFEELATMDAQQAARARTALLRYCELDTLAMVRIWQKLREVAASCPPQPTPR